MIRAVIFDLDNVLADSEKLHFRAFSAVFADHGKVLDQAVYDRLVLGLSDKVGMANLLGHFSLKADVRKLIAKKHRLFLALAKDDLFPVPGSVGFLRSLHGKFKLALATGSELKEATLMISKLGIKGLFDAVLTAEDIKRSKPDPEIYLKAAKRLGVHPDDCVVIEDSPSGVEAAKSAGMFCIGVPTSVSARKLGRADIIIENFDEIRDMKSLLALVSVMSI
ncbi:HAD family phosphatase [Candidatus Woesearchaeota archaeon]|nr:HAD family phosphatase [Candidatus Woesearchaeota archaeon]